MTDPRLHPDQSVRSEIVNAGTTEAMPMRRCPECGQTGRGLRCHHWDATGARTVATVKVASDEFQLPKEDR